MARIRSIKPEYWTSEQVMEVSRDARLLFIGLWTFSDDGGNHPASPKTLKAEVFPGDDDVTASTVMQWIDELIEQQLVVEYEADGKEFWHVTGWHHQRIDQPTLRHPIGDTGDAHGDAGDTRHHKRLGGKQRQLLLKKLREAKGDVCHLCGDAQGVTLARVTDVSPDEANEFKGFRLVCASCKRKTQSGDAQVTQGDARCLDGDSPTERKGEDKEGSNRTPHTPQGGQPTAIEKPGKPKRSAVGLLSYLQSCRQSGVKPIAEGDAVFAYADQVGIPLEFLRLHWLEFKARYGQPDAKRYKDWAAVHRKSVRGNWFRIWYIAGDGTVSLTTVGEQARRLHGDAA
ncbi:hypothetical protein CURE108131_20910 [Cupriavidus respiraculi]|uniref:Phage protein n=1 Tax=Cupriavidus respiraculi TaxID=195930 RepID=A0ABN7YL97_9BURK|nr:hypothetical protein [Cupriavidus respiraculi]CAG9173166.1 hypothetical protein LMG21510_02172 [Cupriavidus respiraculi]